MQIPEGMPVMLCYAVTSLQVANTDLHKNGQAYLTSTKGSILPIPGLPSLSALRTLMVSMP